MTDGWVVWFGGVPWDGIPQHDRSLATAFSAHAPVLWIDPPSSPVTPTRHRADRTRSLRPRITRVTPDLVRLSPVALPGLTRPGIRRSTAPLVRAQVRWALRRLGIRPRAAVSASLADVLGRWGPEVVDVLHGTDDWVAGARLMRLDADWLEAAERVALARADRVVVVSQGLADRWAGLGAAPVIVPNGCHPPAAAGAEPVPVPSGLPTPVAVLAGQLSDRIDIGLVEAVADTGISLLVVGPHDERWEPVRFRALVARENVRWTGPVPAEEVAGHLAAADVGLTPYGDSAFNRASFPLKTLDYLAAGLPVVSTDLPASRWLVDQGGADGCLALAPDAAAFAGAVLAAAAGGGDEIARGCRALAARHSWADRARRMAAVLGIEAGIDRPSPRLPSTDQTLEVS
jgi:glycosyltransferase involved in cell wall biosynthesis